MKDVFKDANKTYIITIVAFIIIIILSLLIFKPRLENPVFLYKEAPLDKNSKFQLLPGEEYSYAYLINNTQINITYRIYKGNNCTVIRLMENMNSTGVCVDEWGMDSTGSNATLQDPTILLFKPWMLALEDRWKWNNSLYVDVGGTEEHLADTTYRVMRRENYRGREAFVVEISSEAGPEEYEWIDVEKRVLLKTTGETYVVEITEGLPLD